MKRALQAMVAAGVLVLAMATTAVADEQICTWVGDHWVCVP